MKDKEASTSDKTLRKGLRIVETLASAGPLALREISEACDLSKGNAHHLLKTLMAERYVSQNAAGNYAATLRIWEIASRLYEGIDLVSLARPSMQRLSEETRETVLLAVLDGMEVIYLAKIDGLEPVRSYTKIGGRAPAYCVATGKALLAFTRFTTPPWRDARLDSYTEKTITDIDKLEEELTQVRKRGYSLNRGEWRGAVHGLAAPIYDFKGDVVAAIGIAGPRTSMPQKRLVGFAPRVVEEAETISQSLGAQPIPRKSTINA